MYYRDGILCLRRDNYKEMPGEINFLLIIFKECGSTYPYVKNLIFKVMCAKEKPVLWLYILDIYSGV